MQLADHYLPIIRARADQLRPGQEGQAWIELREVVARLLARLISDHRAAPRIVEDRPGVGKATCIAFSDHEAALRVDDGVFWIYSAIPWTVTREARTWGTPHDPVIVMLYAGVPPGAVLH